MKPLRLICVCLFIIGFASQVVAAENELDVAEQVTGVTLAEKRDLKETDEIKKSNGSQNMFLAAAKKHQLEFAELLGLAQAIKEQLSNTDSYEADKHMVDDL